MTFDYKKEYKELYLPKTKPEIIKIPAMNFVSVSGKGDPNEENGEYRFWWQDAVDGIDYSHKESFQWISLIRLPDFVTADDLDWALNEAAKKKKMDFSKVEFFTYTEGLCVQCMHIGTYDNEPATVSEMEQYAKCKGYKIDITPTKFHHEIYLSDARKCDSSKLKTVIRHPITETNYNR